MTNEEAIVVLQKIKPIPHRGDGKSITHTLEIIAIDMAIKALERQTCEDAISRQALIEKATSWDKHFIDSERCVSLADIQNAPSVTPQPKMGKWIEKTGEEFDAWAECSKCGCVNPFEDDFNYCPNCGARMETETKIEHGLNYSDQNTMMPAT